MSSLYRFVVNFSDLLNLYIFGFNRMKPMFAINAISVGKELNRKPTERKQSVIEELMSDGLLLAVPKKRRTVERRLVRRFGVEGYPNNCRMIRSKQNIIVCDNCGQYHELHTICGNCYDLVKRETNLIIDEIKKRFNCYEPIEREVEIRYSNDQKSDDQIDVKRIVEMDRQRPEWFAKNLLSKTVGNKWIERNAVLKQEEPKVVLKD